MATSKPLQMALSSPLGDALRFVSMSGQEEISRLFEYQVQAISDEIEDKLAEAGAKTLRREGKAEGRWVLLDFGDLIVHVFHEEDRMYYSLERLWKDCPAIPLAIPAA